MEITAELKKALHAACKDAGGQSALAKKSGVKQQNISRWLSGSVTEITSQNLIKLWPIVHLHLPEERVEAIRMEINANAIAKHSEEHPEGNYVLLRMMLKALYDIGGDWLLMQILMYWFGMSEEQRKDSYIAVSRIAETKAPKKEK